jgi:hypothetical protein
MWIDRYPLSAQMGHGKSAQLMSASGGKVDVDGEWRKHLSRQAEMQGWMADAKASAQNKRRQ